jgi:hypothetical protein
MIISHSPICQNQCNNFEYLQEGIPFVSLIIIVSQYSNTANIFSMTLKPIKKGD